MNGGAFVTVLGEPVDVVAGGGAGEESGRNSSSSSKRAESVPGHLPEKSVQTAVA